MKYSSYYVVLYFNFQHRQLEFMKLLPVGFFPSWVEDAGKAIGMLDSDFRKNGGRIGVEFYAGICLDHDLHKKTVTGGGNFSGTEVSAAIIKYVSPDVPILIHSMNPKKAPGMVNRLQSAGFDVVRMPYADLEQEAFHEWLEIVRENAEDL
ncbi:hypothetical protein C4565_10025 [Candidatus Parcubacteria bacterium]|nr:MAG: hypothetical protein C4565_10025 [Candidatus Parcubacteria bacterium]